MRTARRDALRRENYDLFRFGGCVALFVLDDAHALFFSRQREGHKDCFAFKTGEKGAAVDRLFDLTRWVGESSLLAHVEEAETRQSVVNEQLFGDELVFDLPQLHGSHAAAIRSELAGRMFLEVDQKFFGRRGGERGKSFLRAR